MQQETNINLLQILTFSLFTSLGLQILIPNFLFSFEALILGIDAVQLEITDSNHYQYANLYKVNIIVTQLIAFGFVALVSVHLYRIPFKYHTFFSIKPSSLILFSAIIMISALPILGIFAIPPDAIEFPSYLKDFEESLKTIEAQNELVLKTIFKSNILLSLLTIAIIPAIMEELFFRGFLLKLFTLRLNFHAAIFITALIFSFLHFQIYGFFVRFFLGILFGYLFFWSNSLIPSIIAHFINNAIGVLIYSNDSEMSFDNYIKSMDDVPKSWLFAACITFLVSIYLFYNSIKHYNNSLTKN